MNRIVFAAVLLLAIVPAFGQDNAAAVANGFYAQYASLPRAGGIPDATARARLAPFLSPRLGKLIADAAAAQTRFMNRHKDSPPLIEGDLFSSLFEGFTTFKIGNCAGDGRKAECSVALVYQEKGQKPVRWTDSAILVSTATGWKLDDLAYKAGFTFGNTGLLSDTLKMAIAEAS